MALDEPQKKFLRTLAHNRKPVVMVGSAGLTENVLAEVENALTAHELIKVRVRAHDRDARDGAVARILETTGADAVQRIGHVLTLYRRHPTDPKIEIPSRSD